MSLKCVIPMSSIVAIAISFAPHSYAAAGEIDEWREGAAIEACERDAKAAEEKTRRAQQRMADAYRIYGEQLVDGLISDGTARDLALATLLQSVVLRGTASGGAKDVTDSEMRSITTSHAAALAKHSDDPLVYALLSMAQPMDTASEQGADDSASRDEVIRRWRASDPENLAPIWAAHHRVVPTTADDRTADASMSVVVDPAFFSDARRATRYDTAYDDVSRLMIAAMRRYPPDDTLWKDMRGEQSMSRDAYAGALGMALWSSNMPAFQSVMRSCKAPHLALPQRRDDCRHIADLMVMRSDTLIARLIGIAVGRYSAHDAADKQAFTNERRLVDWLTTQWRLANAADPSKEAESYVALLSTHADIGEIEIMRRSIEAAGLPLEPPPDWESGFKFPDERNAKKADDASKATP